MHVRSSTERFSRKNVPGKKTVTRKKTYLGKGDEDILARSLVLQNVEGVLLWGKCEGRRIEGFCKRKKIKVKEWG